MQNRKPNIAVICGGDSSEYVVSVKSGQNVFEAIDCERFVPWLVLLKGSDWQIIENGEPMTRVDKSDFSFLIKNEKTTIGSSRLR